MNLVLGIDIGGSGVKGAMVDLSNGTLASERCRIPTPRPSTPKAVGQVVLQLSEKIRNSVSAPAEGPVGLTVPAPVVHGVVPMIANLDQSWTNLPVERYFSKRIPGDVNVVNDADAAGIAEVLYGAAKNRNGVVIVTTLGTGIGTAVINNGELVPNTELGHLEIDGKDAETLAAASRITAENISMSEWAGRLDRYYQTLEKLFWPDLIVVGGSISKQHHDFLPLLHLRTPIVPAKLRNQAGIVGAAWLADQAAARKADRKRK